jgi:hypothetical protein
VAGACLVAYEAAIEPAVAGVASALVLDAMICGAIGAVAGWFIGWLRHGGE